jgi:hypothetical protein
MRPCLVVLLVAGLTVPAQAFDGPCHREAGQATTCVFPLKSTPITMRAESLGSNVRVHVWVTVRGYPEIPPLAECSATGSGYVECANAIPDSTTMADLTPHPLVPVFDLVCNFEGTGDWAFGCDAGR